MSDAIFRAPLGAVGHPAATAPATQASETPVAPPERPHGPRGGMTAREREIWRWGWERHERAVLDLLGDSRRSLSTQIARIPMPEPMREPDGLCERGA